MRSLPGFLLAIFLVFFLGSCGKKETKETDLVTFTIRGEVVGIDTTRKTITIAHEEIPNYMMAMTMPFKVKNPALLSVAGVGDSVQGTLAVSRTESWLEALGVIGKGETPATLSPEAIMMHHLILPGNAVPNVTFMNQDGRQIHLDDYRGNVLALTFIYTRCPLPDFCIRMSNHFAKLQNSLRKERSLDGKWHLLSVSFDPKFDSPGVMKEYGKSYGADFALWEFATDPDTSGRTVTQLANAFDLEYEADQGLINHNLRTVIIDKEGKLVKVITGNEWTPDEVASEMRALIQQ
jgi:protein SCO1/2